MEPFELKEVLGDQQVVSLLLKQDHLALATYIGRTFFGFTDDDEKYIQVFWDTAFNKGWIYVHKEMVVGEFGYVDAKNTMNDFYKKLEKEFERNIDYVEVDQKHELVKVFTSGLIRKSEYKDIAYINRRKHYIITGETYKTLLQSAQTSLGKATRKYFIKVERLCATLTKLIFEHMRLTLESQTERSAVLEKRELLLKEYIHNMEPVVKNQIFYIATSTAYANQNRFKYGGCRSEHDLANRLSSYNTGRAEGDIFYYAKIYKCSSYKTIEERIHHVLGRFKDKQAGRKEMIILRYNCLINVADLITEECDRQIDYVNERCQEFLDMSIDLEPIIPEPIDLGRHVEVRLIENGNVRRTRKVDISEWSRERIFDEIELFINKCASDLGMEYDIKQHGNITPLELQWSMLSAYMKTYNGFTMTAWRELFKGWIVKSKPQLLRVKGIKI